MKRFFSMAALLALVPFASAQQPPKPGPEIEHLKKMVGDWDLTMKMAMGEGKGTASFKMELGGLWLNQSLAMDMGGMKFEGKGMDSYDAEKKKYVGVWFDSFSTLPMTMEGTFDDKSKTSTMSGDARDMTGKMVKHTCKTTWKDENNFTFEMYQGDGKEPAFTIEYKRKK